MLNAEFIMLNCGISFGNVSKKSATPTQSFSIHHSAFCIGHTKSNPSLDYHNPRITLALFHPPWYNVRSHKTRRLFMKQFAAQFYFGYYYFFKVKK